MPALKVTPPYELFDDADGAPLEDGYIYIGEAGLNPESNPVNVYFDAALTIPASQPIRTIAGYPSNNGTPANIYVGGSGYASDDYSIIVKNKTFTLVHSSLRNNQGTESVPVFTSKADAVSWIDVYGVSEGQQYFVTSDDGGPFIGKTGAAPGTYADDGASYCGTQFIPTGGDGSIALDRQYNGPVSVKWFGAVGDGVTDDTNAFDTAIIAGRSVMVSEGTYQINLVKDGVSNVTLTGTPNSILKGIVAGTVLGFSNCTNIKIEGLKIQGVRTYVSGSACIKLDEVDEFQILGNHVIDSSRMGITAQASEHGVIANNLVESSYQDGIMVRRGDDVGLNDKARHITVVGNTIYNVGIEHLGSPIGEGIHVFDAEYITVTGNSIYNSFNNGVALEGADDCVVSSNIINASGQSGVSVNKGAVNSGLRSRVSSNNITGNGDDGIVVTDVDDTLILGNDIHNNATYGINHGIDSGLTQNDTIISNNSISDNGVGGIILDWNNNDTIISGNNIRGAAGTGILINRAGSVNTKVNNNNISGFPVSQIQDNGTTSYIHHNIGYVTENRGTGSIPSGATVTTITHGLSFTPTAADVTLTPAENTTNDAGTVYFWNANATTFDVRCRTDPGASNLDFGWKAD
jgi:parallel beta-helix repeat protein